MEIQNDLGKEIVWEINFQGPGKVREFLLESGKIDISKKSQENQLEIIQRR